MRAFAAEGFAATSVRKVAADAGVSPGLVIHHFGSKAGLRQACDEHLLAALTATKVDAVRGPMEPAAFAGAVADADLHLAYFARGFADGHDHAAALFDGMVAMAEQVLAEAEATGAVRPAPDPRTRAAVLVAWQVGQLVLAEHVARAVGRPPLTVPTLLHLAAEQTRLLTEGLYTDDTFLRLAADAAAAVRDPGDAREDRS